jgi:hypothetical protein
MANTAASRMLGFTSDSPEGDPIEKYIPVLSRLLRSPQVLNLKQTKVEASGRRRAGDTMMLALQAAAALPQVARLEGGIERRQQAAACIVAGLAGCLAFRLLERDPRATRPACAQFWIRYDEEAGGVVGATR